MYCGDDPAHVLLIENIEIDASHIKRGRFNMIYIYNAC